MTRDSPFFCAGAVFGYFAHFQRIAQAHSRDKKVIVEITNGSDSFPHNCYLK
jgi:hypothetical protein